jgi:endonuclease/exonuclease/phosphatase (EEP) superfamily protein YafD
VPSCDSGLLDNKNAGTLDASALRLLNWNVHKVTEDGSLDDLRRFSANADLVLIQEALLTSTLLDAAGLHHVFGVGFEGLNDTSGVLTASRIAPVTGCSLQYTEPWLRSAKATTASLYRLENEHRSLLVINTHMINFAIGLSDMSAQLGLIEQLMADHDGPVIVSGDFNTWHEGRDDLVHDRMQAAGLTPVSFGEDNRALFFGRPLDHIFTRGLALLHSQSLEVSTSDHNPMLVTLKLEPDA